MLGRGYALESVRNECSRRIVRPGRWSEPCARVLSMHRTARIFGKGSLRAQPFSRLIRTPSAPPFNFYCSQQQQRQRRRQSFSIRLRTTRLAYHLEEPDHSTLGPFTSQSSLSICPALLTSHCSALSSFFHIHASKCLNPKLSIPTTIAPTNLSPRIQRTIPSNERKMRYGFVIGPSVFSALLLLSCELFS